MPIRDKQSIKPRNSNIGAAFEVDSDLPGDSPRPLETHKGRVEEVERKTAIIQVAVYPSWRKHFHIEAAKRGEKLAPVALKALIERYGLPEGS